MYFRSSENHRFCCGFSLVSGLSCPQDGAGGGGGRGGYPVPTVGQSHGAAWGPTGRPPARHGERGRGRKANIIRKGKDEKQTEQPSLALNKYSVEIQKPR